MIAVDGGCLGLIGDSLAAVPWLLRLAEKYNGVEVYSNGVNRFNSNVRSLLRDLPIWFIDGDMPPDVPTVPLALDRVFRHCNTIDRRLHMMQGWFAVGGETPPPLPFTVPMYVDEPADHYKDAILVAPFSRSDHQNNKVWPFERWAALLRYLGHKTFILGSKDEEYEVFRGHIWLGGEPLPYILGAIRSCKLFMSVDNGIGHLAHLGGVAHHLMLQPECLTEAFVRNPHGRFIRNHPVLVKVEDMLRIATEMLRG